MGEVFFYIWGIFTWITVEALGRRVASEGVAGYFWQIGGLGQVANPAPGISLHHLQLECQIAAVGPPHLHPASITRF